MALLVQNENSAINNIALSDQKNDRCKYNELPEKFDLISNHDGILQNKIDTLFIGSSVAARNVKQMIELAAPSSCPILITGPSGSGKEVAAQAIHALSPRRGKSIISINCGALPSELIESELFGHSKGAFTGAHKDHIGLFEQADGGTLFLDEIGDMPLNLQVRLLRTLEDGMVRAIGGQEKKIDVRIIAATNKDIGHSIGKGAFREDLYYRLSVLSISIPSLKDRRDDVRALIEYFGEQISNEQLTIDKAGWHTLINHDWGGNVRELRNFVSRASLFHSLEVMGAQRVLSLLKMGMVQVEQKVAYFDQPATAPDIINEIESIILDDGFDIRSHLKEEEIKFMKLALQQANGVIAQSARALGMKRTTFVEKMKRYNL